MMVIMMKHDDVEAECDKDVVYCDVGVSAIV